MSHIGTKDELTSYLAQKILHYYKGNPKKVLVMYRTTIQANYDISDVVSMPEMKTGHHSLEEGDQLVILNAYDIKLKYDNPILDIFSVDTDVFILLIGTYAVLPPKTSLLRTMKGAKISIRDCFCKLGRSRAEALIGWYAFKGSDNTGSFATKGVATQFNSFMECDDDILDGFAVFGLTQKIPDLVFRQMERYVCLLYSQANIIPDNVKDLRWMLFAQRGKEGQQLPPTLGTLKPHVERAYFMALVWKSLSKPCPMIPPATDYSWDLIDGHLTPRFCDNPPAPHALLQLRRCSCNGSCKTNHCGCKKNNLMCTDACECGDACENIGKDYPAELEDDISD